MSKAVIFFAPGLEECEGLLCVDILRRAGVEVTIAAVGGEKIVKSARQISVVADALAEELDYTVFDACILPGGIPGVPNLKADATVRRVCRDFAAEGKVVAAICAAPTALAAFGVIGCMQLHRALKKIGCPRGKKALTAAACAASLLLAWFATPNAFLRGQKLEQLAQGRLAAAMPEGATLLQYSHLDDGLYLAAHTLPREKYFVLLNVQLEAMRDALNRAVREAVPDYVLVSWRALPAEFDRYELIASDVGYDDDNRLNKTLYLYRRKSE